ncbi:SLBB domain-containing protein [bacterium]|nr:SLBB domain-containing protein [bacterium]
MPNWLIKVVSVVLIFCLSSLILAQNSSLVGPQKYRIAKDSTLGSEEGGDLILLITINVWGEVARPGVYEIPDKTDLISALSLTGGPTASSKIDEIKIVRGDGENKEVIVFNAKKWLKNEYKEEIPILQPGDTIVVPRTLFPKISGALTFVFQIVVIYDILTRNR